MSYFEIFFYCLSFALACGFVVHMAATAIISNLEDESADLFPDEFISLATFKDKAYSTARVNKKHFGSAQLTSMR